MKNHPYKDEIKHWIKLAHDDLKTAKVITEEKAPAWAACFHCQQTVEKALKGLLLYKTNAYPKEHDLVKLSNLAKNAGIDMARVSSELEILTNYYVGTRYSGIKEYKINHHQANKAIELAENVLKFVTKQLNKN